MNSDFRFILATSLAVAIVIGGGSYLVLESEKGTKQDQPIVKQELAISTLAAPKTSFTPIIKQKFTGASPSLEWLLAECSKAVRASTPKHERNHAARQEYVDATRNIYPSPPPKKNYNTSTFKKTSKSKPRKSKNDKYAPIKVYDCHSEAEHGSIADRKCRGRMKESLRRSCWRFREKFLAASGTQRNHFRKLMNSYCRESDRYRFFD